jgi:hypothetical protein
MCAYVTLVKARLRACIGIKVRSYVSEESLNRHTIQQGVETEKTSFEQQPPWIFENLFRRMFQLCIMVTEYKNLNYVVNILYVYWSTLINTHKIYITKKKLLFKHVTT